MGSCISLQKPNITLKPKNMLQRLFLQYPEKGWNLSYIFSNPNIDIEFIEFFISRIDAIFLASLNPNLTIKYILSKPKSSWNWFALSLNSAIHIDDILRNRDLPWLWHFVSGNPSITIKHITQNADIPWNYERLCKILKPEDAGSIFKGRIMTQIEHDFMFHNFKIPLSQLNIINYKEILRDLQYYQHLNFFADITSSPNIYIEDILESRKMGLKLSWDPKAIQANPNFYFKEFRKFHEGDVLDESDFEPNYKNLSQNPNLEEEYIIENIDQDWDWEELSRNKFNYNPYRRRNMAVKIQRLYMKKKLNGVTKLMLKQNVPKVLIKLIYTYL